MSSSTKHTLHSQSRPNRTPRQHRVVMNRMGKIFRLFRPGGMTNVEWYYSLTNKTSWI
jgi:hypothetical protein